MVAEDMDGDQDKKVKDTTSGDSLRGAMKEEKDVWAEARVNGLDSTTPASKTSGETSQSNGDSADCDAVDDDDVSLL